MSLLNVRKDLPLALAFSLCLLSGAMADESKNGSCTVEAVTDRASMDILSYRVEVGKRNMPLLDEISRINAKAIIPDKPLKDQINASDTWRFGELRQQLVDSEIRSYVKGEIARDNVIVQKMFDDAWKLYNARDNVILQELVDDAPKLYSDGPAPVDMDFPGMLLVGMRSNLPEHNELTAVASEPNKCTLETALVISINSTNNSLQSHMNELRATQQSLAAKYGMANGEIGSSKMTPEDKATAERAIEGALSASKQVTLVEDLQNILDWWRVAASINASYEQDLTMYGSGEFGTALKGLEGNQNLDARTKMLFKMWHFVDGKMPSYEYKAMIYNGCIMNHASSPGQCGDPPSPE